MLTKLLKIYLEDGADFAALIDDYGKWARYSGVGGYSTGHHRDGPSFIDDESAMIIDRAFGEIKKTHRRVFKVLEMYYIRRMDVMDIAYVWNRMHRERGRSTHAVEQAGGSYAVRQFGHKTRHGADADLVCVIVEFYTRRIREILKDFEQQAV